MSLIVTAAAYVTGRLWTRWERLSADPATVQKQLLLKLIGRNRATVFGTDHGFTAVRSLEDYRKQVAIGDFERLRPYVERAAHGEARVLTEEPVLTFNLTSGSTGAPKLIPITAASRANHRQLTRLWYYRAYRDHPGLFSGKILGVVSPACEGKTAGNIPFGAASGLIHQSSPRWIQNAFALPYQIAEVKDFTAKYYLIMRLALELPISFLGTPNPSTILRLVESADRAKDEIIKDICDGTIAAGCNLTSSIRQFVESRLKKNPRRAAELERMVNHYGALRPRDYWPELQMIGCWKGGSVGVRLNELSRWFGDDMAVRDLGFMASEAQITLPITDVGSAGILDVSANFYEFVAERDMENERPAALACNEVKEGENYYLILTTPGGLYRYDINDVVRVAGFYNRTPLIEFVRKGRDVTNITGEKLHVNQVIQAMTRALTPGAIGVQHYRAFADVALSRYAFMIEFNGTTPNENALKQLLAAIDSNLSSLNIEYAQKRQSLRLKPPVLYVMRSGWFERKAKAASDGSSREIQFKAQLLSTMPEEAGETWATIEI
jgi:hypothetical protein